MWPSAIEIVAIRRKDVVRRKDAVEGSRIK